MRIHCNAPFPAMRLYWSSRLHSTSTQLQEHPLQYSVGWWDREGDKLGEEELAYICFCWLQTTIYLMFKWFWTLTHAPCPTFSTGISSVLQRQNPAFNLQVQTPAWHEFPGALCMHPCVCRCRHLWPPYITDLELPLLYSDWSSVVKREGRSSPCASWASTILRNAAVSLILFLIWNTRTLKRIRMK